MATRSEAVFPSKKANDCPTLAARETDGFRKHGFRSFNRVPEEISQGRLLCLNRPALASLDVSNETANTIDQWIGGFGRVENENDVIATLSALERNLEQRVPELCRELRRALSQFCLRRY